MLPAEEIRRLGWVPYVLDFTSEESVRFAAALALATEFDDLPQWVKDSADAADRKVGVRTMHTRRNRDWTRRLLDPDPGPDPLLG